MYEGHMYNVQRIYKGGGKYEGLVSKIVLTLNRQ